MSYAADYGVQLTLRQLEVLRATALAYPKLAARNLGITEQTLKNHLYVIRKRLGVRNHTELVMTAIGRRYITCEEVLG